MRQFTIACCVSLLGTSLFAGCASTGSRNPLFAFRNTSEKSEASPVKKRFGNPFQAEGKEEVEAEQTKAVASTKPDEKEQSAKASPTDQKSIGDAKLMTLIDEELPEMSPDEKYNVFVELRGVDPLLAPRILRIRRRGWEMKQGELVADANRASESVQAQHEVANTLKNEADLAARLQTQLTAAQQLSPTNAPKQTGLGTVSPWDLDALENDPSPRLNGDSHSIPQQTVPVQSPDMTGEDFSSHLSPQTGNVAIATLPPNNANRGTVQRTGHSLTSNPVQFDPTLPIDTATQATNHQEPTPETRFALNQNDSGQESVNALRIQPNPNAFSPPKPQGSPSQQLSSENGVQAVAFPPLGASSGSDANGMGIDEQAWLSDLEKLIALTEAEIAQIKPGATPEEREFYLSRHVHLRMLYLIAGQQERALQAVPYVEPSDQEFWQQMFWAIANYFDDQGMPDSADRASQTITQLRSGMERLREKARLELRNVTFSHKITSFGSYERYQRDEFSPGQPVLVYAEVENFKSEPAADGQFRTILKSTVEIYRAGPNGELVHREEFPATEDLCRNHRRDYFHSYEVTIPQRISLGPHVLKLTVEDQLSRKLATYSLNFTVK